MVFRQINEELLGRYGWDGIWADNTEPQAYPDPVDIRTADTALGKGVLNINAYPLEHSRALYEGWRSVGPAGKRVYVFTRSGFAGQQRYATTCWSGDIQSDFPTLQRQIPAGLDFAAAGMPYWTTDIGGYWGHTKNWKTAENNELFTRWFEYGAFCPIFRIHGGGTRELYSDSWSDTTKATLLKFDDLRYRLMPYIYSLGWRVTHDGDTMMRPLIFDYPERSERLQRQGPIPVRPRAPGRSRRHRRLNKPPGVFSRRDMVRLLDRGDGLRRQNGNRRRASARSRSR